MYEQQYSQVSYRKFGNNISGRWVCLERILSNFFYAYEETVQTSNSNVQIPKNETVNFADRSIKALFIFLLCANNLILL
jgi:hypothetical protein